MYNYFFMQQCSATSSNVHMNYQNGEKCELNDFDSGIIVCVCSWSISITADLSRFTQFT